MIKEIESLIEKYKNMVSKIEAGGCDFSRHAYGQFDLEQGKRDCLDNVINVIEDLECAVKAMTNAEATDQEINILRHRIKWCATIDEAEKMALIRAIQDIAQAVGLSPTKASPKQIVTAVQAMAKAWVPAASGYNEA